MDMNLRVPYGYQYNYRTLREIQNILLLHYHPEYVRRIIPWLHSKRGVLGVGGHWRATGTQPDKEGFAPEGKSFHQDQRFSDGFFGASAVDLCIARKDNTHSSEAIPWALVPKPGSAEALRWGLHCNIGSEVWHMQFHHMYGYTSWVNAGRPSPKVGYPIPVDVVPPPTPSVKEAVVEVKLEILRVGSRGRDARRCQALLNARAREHGSKIDVVAEDAHYGEVTAGIVKFVQGEEGLTMDGICGPRTWQVLLEDEG